jgi:DHA1 family tetracycline resistance protein-like MFS transporter
MALRRNPGVLSVVFVIFFWNLSFHVYPATWAFFMTLRFNADAATIGATLAYTGLLMATVQVFFTGRVVRTLGEEGAVVLGCVSTILSMLGYMLSSQIWIIYAVSLLGFFQGVGGPALNAIVSSRTPGNAQGELQGGIASLNGLGAIIGPLVFTETLAAATRPGVAHPFPGAAFALSAGINALAFLLFVAAARRRPPAPAAQPDAVA